MKYKNIKLYVQEINAYGGSSKYYVASKIDNKIIILDNIWYSTKERAQSSINNDYDNLCKQVVARYEQQYGKMPNNSRKKKTKKTSKKKKTSKAKKITIGQLIAAIVAFAMLFGTAIYGIIIAHKNKNKKNNPDKTNDGLILVTEKPPTETPFLVPTEMPVVTVEPTPTQMPITVEGINVMAKDILDGYMSINASVSNMQVIVNGELIGTKVTEEDIKNAITLLNINDLSINDNDVFRELVGSQQPDAMYQNNQFLMCNLVALNMQEYYANHSTKNFVWFSPMLMNKDDKHDMQVVENYVKRLCDDSLSNKDCNSLMNEFIGLLDNQMMLNRGNGFDSILVMYLELVNNTCQNSIDSSYRNTMKQIEEWKQESSYVGTMNILNGTHNFGCTNTNGYSRKRSRNI